MSDEDISGLLAVVADCGTSTCRAGMSGDETPKIAFPTVVGRSADGAECVVGAEALARGAELELRQAYTQKVASSWEDVERVWSHAFGALGVHPNEHPVLVCEPHLSPKFHKERLAQLLFEGFSVPALLTQSQAVLALFSTGATHGVVVDAGESATHVIPVWDGTPLNTALVHVGVGGGHVSRFLSDALAAQQPSSPALNGMLARQLKERCGRVAATAAEFDAAAAGGGAPSTHKLPDGTAVTVGATDGLRCGEAFFRPELFGGAHGGAHLQQGCHLPTAVTRAVLNCPSALRPSLYSNVILCGGSSLMGGFEERFTSELTALAPAVHAVGLHSTAVELKVNACEDRGAAVWRGGSLLASMPIFEKLCIAKSEYDESGPSIINRKTF